MTPDPATLALSAAAELRGIPLDDYTEGPINDRALMLHRLRVLSQLCKDRADAIEESLVGSMETDRMLIPGLGDLVREEVTRDSWKDGGANERLRDDLARSVATAVAVNEITGEVDEIVRRTAMVTMRAAYDAIPS